MKSKNQKLSTLQQTQAEEVTNELFNKSSTSPIKMGEGNVYFKSSLFRLHLEKTQSIEYYLEQFSIECRNFFHDCIGFAS